MTRPQWCPQKIFKGGSSYNLKRFYPPDGTELLYFSVVIDNHSKPIPWKVFRLQRNKVFHFYKSHVTLYVTIEFRYQLSPAKESFIHQLGYEALLCSLARYRSRWLGLSLSLVTFQWCFHLIGQCRVRRLGYQAEHRRVTAVSRQPSQNENGSNWAKRVHRSQDQMTFLQFFKKVLGQNKQYLITFW